MMIYRINIFIFFVVGKAEHMSSISKSISLTQFAYWTLNSGFGLWCASLFSIFVKVTHHIKSPCIHTMLNSSSFCLFLRQFYTVAWRLNPIKLFISMITSVMHWLHIVFCTFITSLHHIKTFHHVCCWQVLVASVEVSEAKRTSVT